MGFGDKVKDIYFSGEEKWYGMLDKIDAHLPIYKVVDKVDQVVPSFALFIIVIIILLLLIGIGVFGLAGGIGGEAVLQLTIVDSTGNGVSGAEIVLVGIDETYYSNDFGLVEDISLLAGSSIDVTATKGNKSKSKKIYLNENPKLVEIQLPLDSISFDSMTALFLTETGQRINDRLELSYICTSGKGTPANDIIYDGSANINVSSECGILSVTINSEKYETTTKTISQSSETFYLTEKVPAKIVTVNVQLTSGGNLISEAISVKAFKMNNLYYPEDTAISANGNATFSLQEGNYKFTTVTGSGYTSASIANVSVEEGMEPVVIELTQSVLGKIKITTKRGSIQIEEALVTLMSGNVELENKDTNEDGETEFEVSSAGPFIAIATKEGYCSEAVSGIGVGDNVDISMTTDNGSCGGTLIVRVLDQDNKPVQYARAIIFGETDDDSYKLGYADKLTDYNGEVDWDPVEYSESGEKYRVFAFKGSYTGWSTLKEFTSLNENEPFTVKLDIPLGTINVVVRDKDGDPITFADQEPVYVRLYENYGNNPISGKKIIEDPNGTISFVTKAGRRVYAVVEKMGYQSHMTLPNDVIGDGTITFDVVLRRPPIDELYVNYLGLFKNGSQVLKVEPGQEYDAMFELIAPKNYEELGLFVRVGRDNYTKTELDKIYIEELIAPGVKNIMKGSTYNPPKGYDTDVKYLNQDESKWAQVIWSQGGFVQGRIMANAKVRIRDNAQVEEQIVIAYRAWGILDGIYERDVQDDILGTTASNSTKQELYAATKEAYATVGMETLCEESGERAFCITSTYTDPDGLTSSFDTTFDAKNNSNYNLFIKVMNASNIGFDTAKIKLENDEENLYLGNYSIYTPTNQLLTGAINGNDSDWIETNNYTKNSSITFNELKVTPSATGYGSLKLRIRDERTILFEKTFGVNISSNKKMRAEYMYNSKFQETMPKIVSGKTQTLTIKALNNANGLEISDAIVKIYDRFGTRLVEKTTNSLGTVSVTIPASLPGEKLVLKIEKADYETYEEEFSISEDIVEITPAALGFTVNPQTKTTDTKTIKVENKTGFDLTIKEIVLEGKFKGKLDESQIESWNYNYTGTTIASDDYEEIDLKIISASSVLSADDLTGVFKITVTNGYTEWVKEIDATIRVGLGKDADDPNCLTISKNAWVDNTQGEQVSIGFEVVNDCTVDGTPIILENLAAKDSGTGNILGTFSVQTDAAYSEVSRGFPRTVQPYVSESEVVPITLSFVPDGGVNGQTTGTIIFQATNETDSKDQVVQTSISYTIDAINLDDCVTIGADLIRMTEEETGSFSVTNNCPADVYFEIDSDLMTSDDKFTLTTGETKDVSLTGAEGEIGAFNTLIYAREGQSPIEIIDNVKTIIDPDGGCFSLSRYEFDIYDAPDDDYDGEDTAILKNSCTEKNVQAQVEGTEDYDEENILQAAVLGAVSGLVGCLTSEGGWDASCLLVGTGNDNNSAQSKAGQHRRTPTTGGNPQDSLSRQITKGQQNVSTRLRYSTTKIVAASNEARTATNVFDDANKLAEQTIKALERQKAQIVNDEEVIKRWYWKNKTIDHAPTDQEITAERDRIVAEIDEDIVEINEHVAEMSTALATFTGKLNTAINTANASVDDVATRARMDVKENGTSQKDLQARFDAEVTKGVATIDTAFKENIGDFEDSMEENIGKIKTIAEDQQARLEGFKDAVEKKQVALNDALAAVQATKDKSIAAYDAKLAEMQTHVTAMENAKTSSDSSYQELDTKLTELTEDLQPPVTIEVQNQIDVIESKPGVAKHSYQYSDEEEDSEDTTGSKNYNLKMSNFYQKDVDLTNAAIETLTAEHEVELKAHDDALARASDASAAQAAFTLHIKAVLIKEIENQAKIITLWEELAGNEVNKEDISTKLDTDAGNVKKDTAAEGTIYDDQDLAERLAVYNWGLSPNETVSSKTSENGFTVFLTSTNEGYIFDDESALHNGFVHLKTGANAEAVNSFGKNIQITCTTTSCDELSYGGTKLGSQTTIITKQYAAQLNSTINAANTEAQALTTLQDFEAAIRKEFGTDSVQELASLGNDTYFMALAGDNALYTWNYIGSNTWEKTNNLYPGDKMTYFYNSTKGDFELKTAVFDPSRTTTQFLLASSTATSQTSANSSSGILNQYTNTILGGVVAWNSGSALSGALLSAIIELTQASDTEVDESYTFTVDYVEIDDVTLESSDGVSLSVGETTYDYDDYYTSTSGGSGYNITSETLATNYQLVEETELTFTNPSGLVSDTPYQPFEGILTVTASENVYDDEYEYDTIRAADITRGNYEEDDSEWFEFWSVEDVEIADMEEEDLTVEETRTIEKEFHLLFNSYEYTTTIDDEVIGNCTVGAKTGSTGPSAVPKVLFDWDWSNIDVDTCDESNSNYVYCDTTQMTITMLKKLNAIKNFFNTNPLGECPQAIDVAGTKTQTLSETDLDVGITQIQATDNGSGAQLEIVVETNNNLPMDIDLEVKVYQTGTTTLKKECNETQNITSTGTFYCNVDTATAGSGTFDVVSTITPTLCTGCENNESSNDVMNSQLIIGQSGTQDCLFYKTQKDYFEDVLAANGLLSSANGQEMLGYLNFTINLVRDGFSKDFKEDFDDYMNKLTNKFPGYTELESLFESNKFKITWPEKPSAWEAGKYNARIVVEFEEDNWNWNDANDIKEVEIILTGWQKPDVSHAIYDIGFNGLVGLDSDDGRVGYGAGYSQQSEDALTIVNGIDATPNPYSNALTEVNTEVDKDFYTMNTSRRGNVLTIKRRGSKVDLILSPSTAVPLLLDISRTSARDAYAYYTVEVDGEPQTTGSSLITWNGIGNGCVDFAGSGMGTWDNAPDQRESGGNGYGFFWSNAVASGTASFYGTFYAPDDSSTSIFFTRQSEDATFTSNSGSGDLITVDTTKGVESLKDVFDKVENNDICVIGGEYFWNSGEVYESIESNITSRTNSCMTIN